MFLCFPLFLSFTWAGPWGKGWKKYIENLQTGCVICEISTKRETNTNGHKFHHISDDYNTPPGNQGHSPHCIFLHLCRDLYIIHCLATSRWSKTKTQCCERQLNLFCNLSLVTISCHHSISCVVIHDVRSHSFLIGRENSVWKSLLRSKVY